MQFHGIGREEHSAQSHRVTTCMHDHSHFKMETGAARAASASANAQSQQVSQGEGQFSLSAWLEKRFAKGKGLLRSIWGSSEASQAGEPGDRSGVAQMMAQIGESREADSRGKNLPGQESLQPDELRTLQAAQVGQAAAAVTGPRAEEASDAAAAREAGGEEENLWRKMKVRFQDITGQLTGRRRQQEARTRARSSVQMDRVRPQEARPRTKKPDRDALETDSYRVEESYLLDSYDRKGEYSKISTKK